MHTRACTMRLRARARQNVHAQVYASCARVCARIFTKLFLFGLYYLYKDPSFSYGDICKTMLTFVWSLIFYVLFFQFEHQSSTQVWKLYETCWNVWKLYIKMSGYQWKCVTNFSSSLVSYELKYPISWRSVDLTLIWLLMWWSNFVLFGAAPTCRFVRVCVFLPKIFQATSREGRGRNLVCWIYFKM